MRRADILIDRGKLEAALEACRHAAEADPAAAEIYRRIGGLAVLLKQPQAAVDALDIALKLDPSDSAALCNIGAALRELGRADDARERLEASVRANPGHPSAWYNLGLVYADMARWSDAVSCHSRALRGEPRHAKAAGSLSTALLALGRGAEAVAVARQALAAAPDLPELHMCLSEALLATGQLAAGFAEYEWRWTVPGRAAARRHAHMPLWRGEALAGRRLLVHAEQGFGDQLQMCRFISLIPGASEIILEVPAPLVRLFRTLSWPVGTSLQVVPIGSHLPACDVQCPIMSLPAACGVRTPRDVPSTVPYLRASADDVAVWQERLRHLPGLLAGLCWSSGMGPEMISRIVQARKSVPFHALSPFADVLGCSFVSLQKDPAPDPLAPHTRLHVVDYAANLTDFAETAALIACMDVVVTVDTAVAHLAGALGKRVWLLNRSDADWRWSRTQDVAPWYPTLRAFRQAEPGAWTDVIGSVTGMLRELARSAFEIDQATGRGFQIAPPPLW